MSKSTKEIILKLSKKRQAKIKKRSNNLIALELTLRALRTKMNLTQEQLAEILGITQDGISRLENRKDMKISTLMNYVNSVGGNLRLVVDFPDSESILINNFD